MPLFFLGSPSTEAVVAGVAGEAAARLVLLPTDFFLGSKKSLNTSLMDNVLHFVFCACAALLLIGGPTSTGAAEHEDSLRKDSGGGGGGGKDWPTMYVTTILEDPYVMAKGTELEGYCIDLLEKLSEMLHFKYKVGVVKDGKYGVLSPNGNWSGMIGEVVRKEADLAVAPLTITSIREDAVDFTQPFLHTGIGILLEKESALEEASLFHFLTPFSKETWGGIAVAYLLSSLCLFLAARISPSEWDGNDEFRYTFLNSLWFGAGAFTLQGVMPQPKSLAIRIISAIWWLFSIVLLTAYIAGFSFILESSSDQISIHNFEDLVKQRELDFGTMESSSTLQYFKNSKNPVQQMVYESMNRKKDTVLAKNYQEAIQRVLNSDYAFIGESISQDLAVARHCNLVRSPEVLGARGFGIATQKGSPWTNKLSVAILKLGESGELDYLRSKWWESRCAEDDDDHWSPLRPHALGGIFLILAMGLLLGLIVAVFELSRKSKHRAEQEKKSCCPLFTEELSQRFQNRGERRQETAGKTKP
ncbi:probable glutamate receptor [Anolis carolinensis]|nr:PREDICTED: probable glutamate receptor [Anolis carolinensis]|eukprot:XP_003229279.3 PREDICTED: probable glutamate receptor [Anolis carolinensis]